jgi:hypothetical protein
LNLDRFSPIERRIYFALLHVHNNVIQQISGQSY